MSDYFSLPAGGGGASAAATPGEDGTNSERSSQYFMDVGNGGADSIQASLNSPPAVHSEHILPKDDPKSPYHVDVPVPTGMAVDTLAGSGGSSDDSHDGKYVREYPTDILVDRFKKWRKILKGIANYLREVAFAQEQFARINFQLKGSVKFPFLTDLEEGTNKIVDPFDRRGAIKRQQPLTLAQQREQQQLQQQQEMLQQLQQQQQENYRRSQREVSEDHGVDDDFQAVRTQSDTAAPSGFLTFGSGSVQDIQVVLKKYHLSLAAQQLKTSKEITQNLLPRIEDLRKDLHLKIKEIKELSGDFKTNINEHVAITGQLLNRYIASIKYMTTSTAEGDHIKLQKKGTQLKPKHDPYLLKLQLDLQLKRQLLEENYLQEAYINLQSSGMELEKIVYGKIQQFLQKYSALMDAEAKLMIKNLCRELQQGILSKPPAYEWDRFVGHHPACLLNWKSTDPYPPSRKLSDVIYPQMKSPMAKCIRAGYLAKKSKYLKNYNKGYFVLTSNYLHEFKSSNFFNATLANAQNTKAGQSTSLSATQAAKASLVPLMSIALNDCVLTEASDEKFVLVGKPTFNGLETRKVTPTASSNSIHPSHLNEAPAQLTKHTKHTIGKLLKGGKSKTTSAPAPPKPEENDEMMSLYTATQQEPNKTISWSFKPASSNPTEEEIRQFRKWAHDLKNLTSFHNTRDRSKFIEDRILKANYRNSRIGLKHANSTQSMATLDNSARTDISSMRSNRPQHIQLTNPATMPDLSVYRSKCNTPAVDDNGNLITVGERRNLPSNMSIASPLASPRYHAHSGSSQSVNVMNQQPQYPMSGMTITSKGISPSATVFNASPLASPNQRNPSQPTSGSGTTPPSVASANSGRSGQSGGSGGGYFAIPVRNQGDGSQGSTPSFVDAASGTPQPRTATSYTAVPRQYGGSAQPSAVQRSINVSSPLPKVRLNDQEIDHPASYQNLSQSGDSSDFQLQPPGLRKHVSAGDVPTIKNETGAASETASQPYLTRNNGSQTSLNTVSPRTHAIRKHKKNVSFSSLNSLMFSKKNANSNGNQTTDQFMSGGIKEDEGDGNGDTPTIKLHKSIYS
ncbi:ASK10 (YGR097W) and RGC1 (YPR115W) [Zygosaccharomyces parabailii]|nr:ASK10 (YGR097W) and RGC1 (YPR115W) [Zygosaccharomyces parabailii]CDH12452.1 related to Activator of SKN7 protein 10 [Zygosaccharomyces bailii ISA1307]